MKTYRATLATAELLLIVPAVLFMTSLFVRNIQPQRYEPAHTAQQIVMWYSARPHLALWFFLMIFPFTALLTGAAAVLHRWTHDPDLRQATRTTISHIATHLYTVLMTAAALTAGAVLAIVALHVLTD